MHLRLALIFALVAGCVAPAFAQPDPVDLPSVSPSVPVAVIDPSAAPSEALPSEAASIPGLVLPASVSVTVHMGPASPSEPGLTDAEMVAHAGQTIEAVKAAQRMPTLVGIASAIASGLWLLIAVLRKYGGILLSRSAVQKVILGATALATVCAGLADGLPWWQVLFVGASPLLAMAGNELVKRGPSKNGALPNN